MNAAPLPHATPAPRIIAVAAVGLDRESLMIEEAMEAGDRSAINAVIVGI